MPKLFVFAIGGTGERVLRSFTMLLASGVPTFDNYEVYPIIIDYDADNADKKRTMELLQNYDETHKAAFDRHTTSSNDEGRTNQFFAAKLRNLPGLNNYLFPFAPATPDEKFKEYIGYDSLAGETLGTKQFLKSLYDESNRPDTELNLNMNVGFKGNPNIGSVVFHDINETKTFIQFTSLFQPSSGDKVVIIGSLFGGTGASGIPEIVKAIDARTKNAQVATILVLPYFHPMTKNKDTDAIKASRFNSKTKAALSFYKDSQLMDKIDKVYYVGDPYPTVIPYCDGGSGQKNNANIVELISAMMIEHYVAGRGGKNKEFKFSLDANIVVAQGEKSSQRLFMENFDDGSNDNVLCHLAKLSIALKLFNDEITTKNAKDKDFYKYLDLDGAMAQANSVGSTSTQTQLSKLCSALKKFYTRYQDWFKELDYEGDGGSTPANSHRLALCDMKNKYPYIILKEATVDKGQEGSIVDKIRDIFNGKHLLSADYLLTKMNDHLKDYGNGQGHYDTKANALRDGHEPEWVFADILHRTAEDGLSKLK